MLLDTQYCSNVFWGILLILLSRCGSPNSNPDSLTVDQPVQLVVLEDSISLNQKQGQVYYHGKPFSGRSESYYPNGQLASATDYESGKKNGQYMKWFQDGTKSYEANYSAGRPDGLITSWWRNGQLRSESNVTAGVPHGVQKQWYKSGAIFKIMNLVDGKEEGLQQSWRENGKLYNNYEARNGRIFGLKRAALCFQLDDEVVQNDQK